MADAITVESGDVTTITIDRPESMNALTPAVLDQLLTAFTDLAGARVVVLTGAGTESFVAGGDLSVLQEFSPARARRFSERGQTLCRRIEESPVPVIAAINGDAYGAGLELALACDVRVATDRARFAEPELDLGVIPAFGGTQRLARQIGEDAARRMILFGEQFDAEQAEACGLVGETLEREAFEERVDTLARSVAEKPAGAVRAAKAALDARRERGFAAGLELERELFAGRFRTAAQREGMAAFLEHREPEFE